MSSDDYTPISCASHSEYELCIMHRQRLRLTWRDETGAQRVGVVSPVDLITRERVEYLLVKDEHGEQKQIRLDKIIEAQNLKND
ncbi:MAG: Rho-binding antiterminator [Granulosicoccaceae bacterium]|jgi:transcriptional antiterminator Rof (Rho-off)